MKIRIVKRYKKGSPLAGIIESDVVDIDGDLDAAARFIVGVNSRSDHDFEIIDYGRVIVGGAGGREILENPTGGAKGKVLDPRKLN